MNIELGLAVIGAVTVALVVGFFVFLLILTIWERIQWGEWWWDESADGLESGRG